MNTNEAIAQCLLSHGCNANEIAEHCQITRQSALALMNRIDRSRLRSELSAASRAANFPRTRLSLQYSSRQESRCE